MIELRELAKDIALTIVAAVVVAAFIMWIVGVV